MKYRVEYETMGGWEIIEPRYEVLEDAHAVFEEQRAFRDLHLRIVPDSIFEGLPHPLEIFYEDNPYEVEQVEVDYEPMTLQELAAADGNYIDVDWVLRQRKYGRVNWKQTGF